MLNYVIRRLLQAAAVLLILSFVIFMVLNLSGDPARLLLPPDATEAQVREFSHLMGFDQPLLVRYGSFLSRAVVLDFGRSTQQLEPALDLVLDRLPATLLLSVVALLLAVVVGLPLGILSAVRRGTWIDAVGTSLSLAGQSMPIFWIGLMLILLFSVTFPVLPPEGIGGLEHLILPSSTIAIFLLAAITRMVRAAMLDVLGQKYLVTARAKGLAESGVILGHALKNAAVPIVTQIALQLRFVIGGSVITENIFGWPGLGRLMVTAVSSRDYPVVEASVFVFAVLLTVLHAALDICYTYLNPKVRL